MNIKCNFLLFFSLLLFFSIACEDKNKQIPTGEITLETCDENINDNAPSFFKKYFKCLDVELIDNQIVIETDGIPPHQSWYFSGDHPNNIGYVSQGNGYFLNPNILLSQNILISIPVNPTPKGIQITESEVDGFINSSPQEFGMGPVGVALDGVSLFNSLAAPGDDIEKEKFSFD